MSMTHDAMIAVIAAHRDGKMIQQSRPAFENGEWVDCVAQHWNFKEYTFRIKPEPPKPREWWLAVDSHGDVLKVCDRQTDNPGFIPRIHVREVLP